MRTSQTCPQSLQETVDLDPVPGLSVVRAEWHFGQGQRTTRLKSDWRLTTQPLSGPPLRADSLMRLLSGDRNVRKAGTFYQKADDLFTSDQATSLPEISKVGATGAATHRAERATTRHDSRLFIHCVQQREVKTHLVAGLAGMEIDLHRTGSKPDQSDVSGAL